MSVAGAAPGTGFTDIFDVTFNSALSGATKATNTSTLAKIRRMDNLIPRIMGLFLPFVPYCTVLPRECGMVGTSRRAEYSVLLERVYAMPSSAARKGKSMTVLTTRTPLTGSFSRAFFGDLTVSIEKTI